MASAGGRPTAEQLRHDIDSGRTGDKVANGDPAAAPLGTDEEASGTPPSPSAIELARAQENSRKPVRPEPHGLGAAWVLIGFSLALGALIVARLLTLF